MNEPSSVLALLRALWITGVGSIKVARLARAARKKEDRAVALPAIRALIMDWCQRLISLFDMHVETIWREKFNLSACSNRSYVVMSNHASHLDIPLLFLTFAPKQLTMVAKKELFQIPLFGAAMRDSGCCLELDRQSGERAMETLQEASTLLKDGDDRKMVWIAPEGHRSRDGKLGKFKRGGFWLAQHSQAIIIPVTIIGSGEVLPAGCYLPRLGRTVRVVVGPFIDTKDICGDDGGGKAGSDAAVQLMQKVRAILEENLERYGHSDAREV